MPITLSNPPTVHAPGAYSHAALVTGATERLVRRLEEEVQEVAGIVVRLSPTGAETSGSSGVRAPAPETADPNAGGEPGSRPHGLRLLGQEHLMPGEPPVNPRRLARGPGSEERS